MSSEHDHHQQQHQHQRIESSPLRDALPLRLGGGGGSGRNAPTSSSASLSSSPPSSSLSYADAAGAALPPDSLLDEINAELKRTLYTNPHSGGEGAGVAGGAAGAAGANNSNNETWRLLPPGDSSRAAADECRAATLALFKAPPDEYSVVFTSGATAALGLVADAFPWEAREGRESERKSSSFSPSPQSSPPPPSPRSRPGSSRFLYTRDNHTSVLGLRSAALASGASATPVAISSRDGDGGERGGWALSRAAPTMRRRGGSGRCLSRSSSSSPSPRPSRGKIPCLFAFPLESNFSGARYCERTGESLRPPGRSAEVDTDDGDDDDDDDEEEEEEEEEEKREEESGDADDGDDKETAAAGVTSLDSSPGRSPSPSRSRDYEGDADDGDWSIVGERQQQQEEQQQGEKKKKKKQGGGEEAPTATILHPRGEEQWFVLADAAKAATAGSGSLPDLSSCPVDFLCLSYYKIFGYPTGLGALVLSKRGLEALRRGRQGGSGGGGGEGAGSSSSGSRFFGGGTVLSASASSDSVSIRPGVAGLEDGTPAFLAIAALRIAFGHFARAHGGGGAGGAGGGGGGGGGGGAEASDRGNSPSLLLRSSVEAAGARACAVASRLASGLLSLRHADGSRVAVVYGSYEGAREGGEGEGEGVPTWARGGAPLDGNGGGAAAAAVVGQGAVVAFNLLRPRSSSSSSSPSSSGSSSSAAASFPQRAVGHREVERLASLHGVLLRGGTLCNPGAAELALGPPRSPSQPPPPRREDGRGGVPSSAPAPSAASSSASASAADKDDVDCREGSGLDPRGNPTGVLRASFGAGASEEDAAAVLELVRRYFVDRGGGDAGKGEEETGAAAAAAGASLPSSFSSAAPVVITELFVYPVKGAAGFSPPTSSWPLRGGGGGGGVGGGGLAFDREFAVVDADASLSSPSPLSSPQQLRRRLVTPRRCPRLAQLRTFIDLKQRELVLTIPATEAAAAAEGAKASPLRVPLDDFDDDGGDKREQRRQQQRALAARVSAWLTAVLDMPCSLARAPSHSTRGWANEGDLLLVGRGSLAGLRARLAAKEGEGSAAAAAAEAAAAAAAAERFRPNLVVDRLAGGEGGSKMAPHEEDSWESLRGGGGERRKKSGNEGEDEGEGEGGGEILLVAAGGCARCPAVNIDRSASSSSPFSSSSSRNQQQQPLLELAGYRRSVETGRIEFGVLMQRQGPKTAAAENAQSGAHKSKGTTNDASAASTCWLAVGDVLVPTLRDRAAGCPAGGASCA